MSDAGRGVAGAILEKILRNPGSPIRFNSPDDSFQNAKALALPSEFPENHPAL
jgi:hypothetical protein